MTEGFELKGAYTEMIDWGFGDYEPSHNWDTYENSYFMGWPWRY